MQEMDQDPFFGDDYGELPDDLSEFMNDDYLVTTVDTGSLFGDDHLLNFGEELSNFSDTPMPTELPKPDSNQDGGKIKPTTRNNRQKGPGASRSNAARQNSRTKTEGADTGSVQSRGEPTLLSTPPTNVFPLNTSVACITFPDTPVYHFQRLKIHPVLRLPLPSAAAPSYILVPPSQPACQLKQPPFPQEMAPSNESTKVQQSPSTINIPQSVKEYIESAKAYMNQTCEEMEPGLSLTSHYVDAQLIRRERFHSQKKKRKNKNSMCINKQLEAMGDIDRQKRVLKLSEIFENADGEPKQYILLLGNAGMGKTTLIRKLCQDWSRDRLPQFDFLFLLNGKAVSLTEASYSLQTLLLDLSSFVPSGINAQEVYTRILATPKRVLIIFDGFDELRDYDILFQGQEKDYAVVEKETKGKSCTVSQLYSVILQRTVLKGCTLLLSARPRGTASQIVQRLDSLLEISGFTLTSIEDYFLKYFSAPNVREYAIKCLHECSYLRHLCWNPGLCRLVCLVLEHSNGSEDLPKTLTELCHQVLCIKMQSDNWGSCTQAKDQSQVLLRSSEEDLMQVSNRAQVRKGKRTMKRKWCKKPAKRKILVVGPEERELLSQLSYLACKGVKASSSILPEEVSLRSQLKTFGLKWGLFLAYQVRARPAYSSGERGRGVEAEEGEVEREDAKRRKKHVCGQREKNDLKSDHILLWANPFLQCYLAGVHMSLSRNFEYNHFIQNLLIQSRPKGRRRLQIEVQELTQRFVVGIMFLHRTQHRRLHLDIKPQKRDFVTNHLKRFSLAALAPGQALEACHYLFESGFAHGNRSSDSGEAQVVTHKPPKVLAFHSVPLSPLDAFVVQKILEKAEPFSLDLQNTGIQISGLRSLVSLGICRTYRACIADVIALWEQLEQSGERGLLKEMVTKFQVHPLKVMQVCQIDHLAKLVNVHLHRRLSDCLRDPDPILEEGVPAITGLHKLEFELGPERWPLAVPRLWEFLPDLRDLQHLDLEGNRIGDEGAERLADTFASLCFLEILNLSQNDIGDKGVRKLVTTLKDLPKLHCLILYSNVISDRGACSLSVVLPDMTSLTDLEMWNQCIPSGVFERLKQQDPRIRWD
ncbi:MHC class II transactivator isoform X2 [Dunckerocampus dactyliophorus]|uniref:MHC class II transactivator isoform X2 n=1 Tax=Dunckerocampus dactyliophorus TaxID=161453 RepID=UPI0024067795|nr:MHC class II transactivator isoform X2 [Dunckerocampus dactyliophorus]